MAGSIRNRGEDSWQLTVTHGRKADGTKRRLYRTVHCTERQAKKELALFVAEVERKHPLSLENITLADFAEKWLQGYAKPHLAKQTTGRYKTLLERILKAMGHLKITQITPLHISAFYNNLRENGVRKDGRPGGLSEHTIKHHHTIFKKILNDAVKWDLLITNPVTKITTPKKEKKEARFYNEEQIIQLLVALEQEKMQFYIMVQLTVTTGCRRGELVALQWQDIDFENREINIKQSISIAEQGQEIKSTKSEKSRRLTLPKSIIKTLKEYKKYQNEDRFKKGLGKSEWLFTGEGGKLMHLCTASKQFKRFIKKHRLPYITLHGLRHTHGTTLLAGGVDIRTVANRLGHSETSTTLNVYTHALKSADKIAADVMDRILKESKSTTKNKAK